MGLAIGTPRAPYNVAQKLNLLVSETNQFSKIVNYLSSIKAVLYSA